MDRQGETIRPEMVKRQLNVRKEPVMSQATGGVRIVHFLNPFFSGIGGEEFNDRAPQVEKDSRGPGRLLDKLLGDTGTVVATLICGDNYFLDHENEVRETLAQAARTYGADLIIAGPAFNAGRYGLACGSLCQFAAERLGLAAVTAMSPENPATEFRRKKVYIVPTGDSVRSMDEVLPRLLRLGLKLANRTPLASAAVEGYLPRGVRFNERVSRTAAQRAVDMVLAKVRKEPYQTEIRLEEQDRVAPPAPLGPLDQAVVALVTEMGFIPHGNPDHIPSSRAKVWGSYSIAGMNRLSSDQFMYIHGGYNTTEVDRDPNRGAPLDVLREMEREGRIKTLLEDVFSTCGNGGSLNEMKRIGQEMARELKTRGATAVILPAT
jgi:glycine reductase complex component B subunit gamma